MVRFCFCLVFFGGFHVGLSVVLFFCFLCLNFLQISSKGFVVSW